MSIFNIFCKNKEMNKSYGKKEKYCWEWRFLFFDRPYKLDVSLCPLG